MPTRWSSTTSCWHETRVRVARAPLPRPASADLQPERPGDRSPSPHPSHGTTVVLSTYPATAAAVQRTSTRALVFAHALEALAHVGLELVAHALGPFAHHGFAYLHLLTHHVALAGERDALADEARRRLVCDAAHVVARGQHEQLGCGLIADHERALHGRHRLGLLHVVVALGEEAAVRL